MATAKSTPPDPAPAEEESPYATTAEEAKGGKAVGPEHDGSFHAPDFYDPKTGKRIETPWDTEAQKADPGFDPETMAGTVEKPPDAAASGGQGGETTSPSTSSSSGSTSS
jgi:hypothetical protein